jgi:hypothetical protein
MAEDQVGAVVLVAICAFFERALGTSAAPAQWSPVARSSAKYVWPLTRPV